MGEKTIKTNREYKIDPVEIFGTADSLAVGQKIKEWNYRYLMLGPVMVTVFIGIHAVDVVRKLIGHTLPYKAAPGTIRGDFSINAPDLANMVGSACKNLVHASGSQAEAKQEIANWFEPQEIFHGNESMSSCTLCRESSQPLKKKLHEKLCSYRTVI